MSGGRFDRALRFTLGEEGGYSDHPNDHGGQTNWGISFGTLARAKLLGLIRKDVTIRSLTRDQAETIYWGLYWVPSHAFELPTPLDLCLFDAYVNHSPRTAVRLIQAAVKVKEDGVIGPQTIEAARDADPRVAVDRYAWERTALYQRIVAADPDQGVFLKGWLNRVARVKATALAEIPA